VTHQKPQTSQEDDINQQHIDIQKMCWWVISPFCEFAVFDLSLLTLLYV